MCIRDSFQAERFVIQHEAPAFDLAHLQNIVDQAYQVVRRKRDLRQALLNPVPVSYTHLDVYKRQNYTHPGFGEVTIASDGQNIVGLWMAGQKHFGGTVDGEICLLYTSRCV